jgi:hypothetical protein
MAGPFSGAPGTVGIIGLADRIFSAVQYPESACERAASELVAPSAKAGLAIVETASASISKNRGTANGEPPW